jgi:hypothetical protein
MSLPSALSLGERNCRYEQSNRNSEQVFHQLTLPVFANPLLLTKFPPTGHRLGGLRCRELCSRLQCVQRSKAEGIGGTFRLGYHGSSPARRLGLSKTVTSIDKK